MGSGDSPPPHSCLEIAFWFIAWWENRLEQVRLAQVRPTTSHLVLGCTCVRKVRGGTQQQRGQSGPPPPALQVPRSRAVVTQRTL